MHHFIFLNTKNTKLIQRVYKQDTIEKIEIH